MSRDGGARPTILEGARALKVAAEMARHARRKAGHALRAKSVARKRDRVARDSRKRNRR